MTGGPWTLATLEGDTKRKENRTAHRKTHSSMELEKVASCGVYARTHPSIVLEEVESQPMAEALRLERRIARDGGREEEESAFLEALQPAC